ncbi:alpha/beta fold hydrolase [Promicromonospora iranensis]|uniref:Pimeloyl-ACP methyl ester carboxylesterase n=1 Tax=Promicromonospora iranensis TaxID=1105144 RepID=A0ABU2CWQ1_9MICO|nr:alpha/beta fold hydrolase [Promicromonospora iranensis]MDR7385774.1 pimeloyl-ACP methyl ester carboxylesterase [Promicromonospora iranensis]
MILSHDTSGSGPAVLLLHAGVADSRMWDPQRASLAQHHRVIRCDLRGYGDTPLTSAQYDNAGDVKALLSSLGERPVAIVGASAGGNVALQVASEWPDLVSHLILLNSAFALPATRSLQRFARREDALIEAGDIDGATELNVATWLGPDADDDARELVRTMQRHAFQVQLSVEEDHEEEGPDIDLEAISAHTLIVSGGQDLDYFRAVANHLAGHIPGAKHTQLGWAGHLPNLERPDEVTALIRDFLAEFPR